MTICKWLCEAAPIATIFSSKQGTGKTKVSAMRQSVLQICSQLNKMDPQTYWGDLQIVVGGVVTQYNGSKISLFQY